MQKSTMLAAWLAAGLAACAPQLASAQKISDLPLAASPSGTERLRGIQGSGCASHTAPCTDVAVTTAQIATLAGATTQPLDADLSAIAALTTQPFGRSLLTQGDAAAVRGTIGLGTLATQSGTFSGTSSGTNTGDQTRASLGAAAAGTNGDITALTGLTTPLSIAQGGTGSSSAPRTSTHLGYVAGKWFWSVANLVLTTSGTLSANTIYFGLIEIPQSVTLSDLATVIRTAAAGGNVQFAIYALDPATRLPTGPSLAATASISTAATGVISADIIGPDVTLPRGWYYCAVNADNSTVNIEAVSSNTTRQTAFVGTTSLAKLATTAGAPYLTLSLSQTFGTWPSVTSATFVEGIVIGEPTLAFKVSGVP